MKKSGILHSELMGALTALRHTDAIAILDVGMPLPLGCRVIDLALIRGIPSLLDVIKAVLGEIIVEKFTVFEPMIRLNNEMYNTLCGLMPSQQKGAVSAEGFQEELKKAKVCVRTGEYGMCCNVILYSASGLELYSDMYNVECSKAQFRPQRA